jgi:site-specific DNA-cytosine methylase
MDQFPIYGDITKLNGKDYRGGFDVLCGGFPCQAFSHAAHGKNIAEKNLWDHMYRFAHESDAPVVFGENVTFKALDKARSDLQNIGYTVQLCKLSCEELGADHRRDRYWLLAVKDYDVFNKIANHIKSLPKLKTQCWATAPFAYDYPQDETYRRQQLKAIGNAQSPFVAASVFKILVNRHVRKNTKELVTALPWEIQDVIDIVPTWIKQEYGENKGLVHTPTTMANYSCPSMMKHSGCRNYNEIFGRPIARDAEYLMGFPIGASIPNNVTKENFKLWMHNS